MNAGSRPQTSVSVVVPVFNERDNLEVLHREVAASLETSGCAWEMLLVDDGSNDGSGALADRMAREDRRLRVLHLEANSGQSAALAAGIHAARGDVVVTLDADLQNDPADIPRLLAALPAHAAVVGWRRQRADTWVRRSSSRIANAVRNLVTGDRVADTGCSLKVMRREALADVPWTRGTHRFLPTLLRLHGHAVAEVPVNHRPRRAGRSKYGIGNRLFVGLGDLLMVRWMQHRAVRYRVAAEAGEGLPRSVSRFEEVHR